MTLADAEVEIAANNDIAPGGMGSDHVEDFVDCTAVAVLDRGVDAEDGQGHPITTWAVYTEDLDANDKAMKIGDFDGPGLATTEVDGAALTPPLGLPPSDPVRQVAVEQWREMLNGVGRLLHQEDVRSELDQDSRPFGPPGAARSEVVGDKGQAQVLRRPESPLGWRSDGAWGSYYGAGTIKPQPTSRSRPLGFTARA